MSIAFHSGRAVSSLEVWLATALVPGITRKPTREQRHEMAVALVTAMVVDRPDTDQQLAEVLAGFIMDPRRATAAIADDVRDGGFDRAYAFGKGAARQIMAYAAIPAA